MTKPDCTDDYPLVGADPDIRVPPRSVLVSLRPMGLGTSYRESLSSYYLELAHMHHVSPKALARGIIVPRIRAAQTEDSFVLWKLPLFSGMGTVPETWAEQLNELTGRNDLIDLTLVPLRTYTNMQRLTSGKKRWCPLCLAEAAKEGRAYGQLLWEIAAVEACPKHGIKLVSQCACKGESPLSTRHVKHLSGYCDLCGYPLTQNYEQFIENASETEVKRARLVADLLGDVESLSRKSDRATVGISDFLKGAVEHFAGGNAALFGKMLGIKKNTLHGWLHGRFVPTFPQLVDIASLCRCSMADAMLGKKTTFDKPGLINIYPGPQKSSRKRGTAKIDAEKIKHQLKMLARETPPISVATAAEKIGLNRRTLFKNFGDIAKKINQRFQSHRHSEKIRRFQNKCDLYRRSAEKLMRQGVRPSQRSVALDIKGIGIASNKAYERAACERICEEIIRGC